MDLTYLIVTVFGMCGVAVHSLPATTVSTSDVASPKLVAATDSTDNGKKSRSLFQSSYRYQGGDSYNDIMDEMQSFYQQQHYQQPQEQEQENYQQEEDSLRANSVDDSVDQDLRMSSRARPSAKPDSPMYFIRLPPQPYMYVPGYGYISQPTRLEPPPFTQRPHSPFLNLPIGFVANGKPVGVYTLPQQNQLPARPKPQRRPQVPQIAPPPPPPPSQPQYQQQHQQSPVYNLDKGPYVFNGRPTDVFLLQSAYDNLYSEVLQNIYP